MNGKIKNRLFVELGILFLVLLLFFIVKSNLVTFLPPCFIYTHFGILCPSCQGTRCVIQFFLGNFKQSFSYHPIFFITIWYFIIVNMIYIVNAFRKKEILTFLYPKTKFWIFFLIVIGIFTVVRNFI